MNFQNQNAVSSMMNPSQQITSAKDANTNIFRLIYLSSKLATQTASGSTPTNIPIYASTSLDTTTNASKRFHIPPIIAHPSGSVKYKANLRGLDIVHVWPNVKTALLLATGVTNITIPRGNYTATSLATFIQDALTAGGEGTVTVTYDSSKLGFTFGGAGLNIISTSTAQTLIGFPTGFTGTNQTSSTIPLNLMGPSRIHVNTNLSMYTVPLSGRLATIPISTNYGGFMSFRDLDGQQPMMITHNDLHSMTITLADENNVTLEGYEDIPWGIILSLEVIRDQGFVNPGLGHGVGSVPMHPLVAQQFYGKQ